MICSRYNRLAIHQRSAEKKIHGVEVFARFFLFRILVFIGIRRGNKDKRRIKQGVTARGRWNLLEFLMIFFIGKFIINNFTVRNENVHSFLNHTH